MYNKMEGIKTPKLSKNDTSIRPLVNYIQAQILKNKINLENKYAFRNRYEFTDELKNIKIRNYMDSTNHYINISIEQIINVIINKLENINNEHSQI